jgi:neutral amino acid transport system ATP-binding protein
MLEVTNIDKFYGGVKAVENVSIEVKKGKIIGLIGTNGAGKTTLFNVISGFDKSDNGIVNLSGKDITKLTPSNIAELGLIRTFQTATGFPRLTVLENLLVFSSKNNFNFFDNFLAKQDNSQDQIETAENVLKNFGLLEKKNQWVADLSAPELKILEFARAIMGEPLIMLLDEPAAGVNPALLENLMSIITELNNNGVTFLIVDHNLRFICEITDYIYVMNDGKLIAEGTPDEITNNELVIQTYIGK